MMRRINLLLFILLLAAVLGGCRQETQPEVIVITAPPTPAVVTDTVAPTSTIAATPTATPAQVQPPVSQGVNRPIQFATGATSATVANTVVAGTFDRYTLRAQAGQTMYVDLSSTASNATFLVEAPNGQLLAGGTAGAVLAQWEGQLPATGDYAIVVRPTAGDASYRFVVTIPPLAPQGVNQRIQFAAGATSTTVAGSVVAGAVDQYTLGAQAGQTMRVELSSDGFATLLVEAPGRQLLTGGAGGAAVLDQWEGQLPVTGDYVILVRTTIGDASYRLVVTIPPLAAEPAPVRIHFAPGATSATLTGSLVASGDLKSYIFGAAAGQTVTVEFAPANAINVSIESADGSHRVANSEGRLETVLPQTGDYLLDVWTFNADYGVQYSFTITIE